MSSINESIGTTIMGTFEPSSSDMKENTFALYVDGGQVKIKHKDGSGTVTVYLVHTTPPFLPVP